MLGNSSGKLSVGAKQALSVTLQSFLHPPPNVPLYEQMRNLPAGERKKLLDDEGVLFHGTAAGIEKLIDLYIGEPPSLIIDAACGRGLSALALRHHFPRSELFLIDTFPEALAEAKRLLQGQPNVKYFEGDIKLLTLAIPKQYHGRADMVFMSSVVETIDDKFWPPMFFRAGRVLRGGANLLFDVSFASSKLYSLEFMAAKAVAEVFKTEFAVPLGSIPENGTAYARVRPAASTNALLRKSGFRDVCQTDDINYVSQEEAFAYLAFFVEKVLIYAAIAAKSLAAKSQGIYSERDVESLNNFPMMGVFPHAFERLAGRVMYSEAASQSRFRAIK